MDRNARQERVGREIASGGALTRSSDNAQCNKRRSCIVALAVPSLEQWCNAPSRRLRERTYRRDIWRDKGRINADDLRALDVLFACRLMVAHEFRPLLLKYL
jgi:hypothetical protein